MNAGKALLFANDLQCRADCLRIVGINASQQSVGISQDGIVGPITLAKLGIGVAASPPAPSQSAGLTAALPSSMLDSLSVGGFSGEIVAGALAVAALGAFLVFKKKKGGRK